jgi:hypothetical protein
MEVPKLYRISAEVERDQKSRFRVFSKRQGRTMRAQLTHMVGQAIVGVELPEVVAPAAKPAVPAWEPEPPPEFDPKERYFDLIDEMWIPEAKAQMERECRERGITDWFAPPLHQSWWANYRKRCEVAGRDYEEDFYV